MQHCFPASQDVAKLEEPPQKKQKTDEVGTSSVSLLYSILLACCLQGADAVDANASSNTSTAENILECLMPCFDVPFNDKTCPSRGLFIHSPWIEKILDGEKVWEIRGENTRITDEMIGCGMGMGRAMI